MRTSQSIQSVLSSNDAYSVLAVSADRELLRHISRFLGMFGYEVRQTTSIDDARRWMTLQPTDFLILDAAHNEQPKQLLQSARGSCTYDGPYTLLLVGNPDERQWLDAFSSGVDDFLMRPLVFGELLSRLRAGARVREFDRRFRENYITDPGTGWLSPGGLRRFLSRTLEKERAALWACALIDLDHFDLTQQEWGMSMADTLLESVVGRLRDVTPQPARWSVVRPGCYAAAWETDSPEAARRWADTVRTQLGSRPFLVDSSEVAITASLGVATRIDSEEDGSRLWRDALEALQQAKTSGRDCVVVAGDFHEEQRQWDLMATSGRLFETTMARDIMMPLVWLPTTDDSPAAVCHRLRQTRLIAVPVVDSKGVIVGLLEHSACDSDLRQTETWSKLLSAVPATFETETTFDELIEYFAQADDSLAIIVQDGRPVGWVCRDYLASLGSSIHRSDLIPVDDGPIDLESIAVPEATVAV